MIEAWNKIDALDDETIAAKAAELEAAAGVKVRRVSGFAKLGGTELLREAFGLVLERKGEVAREVAGPEDWAP